jgi:hypothetical protein
MRTLASEFKVRFYVLIKNETNLKDSNQDIKHAVY